MLAPAEKLTRKVARIDAGNSSHKRRDLAAIKHGGLYEPLGSFANVFRAQSVALMKCQSVSIIRLPAYLRRS